MKITLSKYWHIHLNNDGNNLEDDDGAYLDENDLLKDIFSLNDLETDTVRLNASTIKQLLKILIIL